MQANKKKKYKSPYLTIVEIDNIVSMQMESAGEDGPPIGPGPGQSSSLDSFEGSNSDQTEETLQKSSFDDNPFRR